MVKMDWDFSGFFKNDHAIIQTMYLDFSRKK